MATKVFLWSPGTAIENVVEGVGGVVQSTFVVGVTINLATNTVADNGTTRAVQKAEVIQGLETLIDAITNDRAPDFG